MASSWTTACAVTAGGGVDCWGSNDSCNLGNGDVNGYSSAAAPVLGTSGLPLSGIAKVSVSDTFACAVTTAGGVVCWGDDAYYELGDNQQSSTGYISGAEGPCSPVAVSVPGLDSGVLDVSTGGQFACALTTGGGVLCWGADDQDELGAESAIAMTSCGNGLDICSMWPLPVVDIDVSYSGYNGKGEPTPRATLSAVGTVTSLSVGAVSSCVVASFADVFCWGYNESSELGTCSNQLASSFVPLQVPYIGSAVQVAVGDSFACALLQGGAVECWGNDASGSLGDFGTNHQNTSGCVTYDNQAPTLVQVENLAPASAIFAGGGSACAVPSGSTVAGSGGRLVCWGTNTLAQLGNGEQSAAGALPAFVSGLAFTPYEASISPSAASVGDHFGCAYNATGALFCWGDDTAGELGNGTTAVDPIDVPVAVSPQP